MITKQHISSVTHHATGSITVRFANGKTEVFTDTVSVRVMLDRFCQQLESDIESQQHRYKTKIYTFSDYDPI